jgi:hypothetical protein
METKFTPGPLTAGDLEYGTILQDGFVLYRLCHSVGDYGRSSERKYADSKLYAAAPDMLEALERIVTDLPSRRDWLDPDIEKLARAAIAKAKR